MLKAIIYILIFSSFIGFLLAYIHKKFKLEQDSIVEKIDKILPQIQCAQCGYPGCKPYAEAIANKEANINQCPPGGQEVIDKLAALLGVESTTLDESFGVESNKQVAFIDENLCIGCTLCIKACPVDAIAGAPKVMTTIIADECTGCKLCVDPCPVDCIIMIDVVEPKKILNPTIDENILSYKK